MEDSRVKVATACRITAQQGLAREIAGHVSERIAGTSEMWIRCRGVTERGVRFTTPDMIHRVGFRGEGDVDPDYELPLELPIHGEIYRARPEVNSVVHAHPTYSVLCAVAQIPIRPLYGCYDMAGFRMADQGIPLFPNARLINDLDIAQKLGDALGDKSAVLMRGHGITAVGATVEEAVLNAIRVERLAKFNWEVAQSGIDVAPLADSDFDFFHTPLKRSVSHDTKWRWESYVAEDMVEQAQISHIF